MSTGLLCQDRLNLTPTRLIVPVIQAEAPFIIALDGGSSSLRAVLFDRWGRSVEGVEARRPHVLTFGSERSPGWAGDARATIHGLSLATRPEDIARAGLEAVALRIALVYNHLRGILPAEPQVVAGGGALLSSPAWQQIIADALGVPIAISAIREASARGAALLALEALGVLPDAGQVPLETVGAVVMPNLDYHRRYQGARERQQRLYDQLVADR